MSTPGMADSTAQRLQALLEVETDLAGQLLALLQRETQILEQRDTDALIAITEEKQPLLRRLDLKASERINLLQGAGLSADKAGFEHLLERLGNPADSSTLWNRLHGLLEQCQQQNHLNGRLLEGGRRHAQQALAILLGGQDQSAGLYDQKGSVKNANFTGHSFAKV